MSVITKRLYIDGKQDFQIFKKKKTKKNCFPIKKCLS